MTIWLPDKTRNFTTTLEMENFADAMFNGWCTDDGRII